MHVPGYVGAVPRVAPVPVGTARRARRCLRGARHRPRGDPFVVATGGVDNSTCAQAAPCATLAGAVAAAAAATPSRSAPAVQHLGRRRVHRAPDLPRRQGGRPRQPARPRQSRGRDGPRAGRHPGRGADDGPGGERRGRRVRVLRHQNGWGLRTEGESGPPTTAGTGSTTTSSPATTSGCTSVTGATPWSPTTCSTTAARRAVPSPTARHLRRRFRRRRHDQRQPVPR